jgi:GT2 family glycosyltransferase
VIICTRNRPALLQACVHSLLLQDYPRSAFEIIVVDDGSTDETASVLGTMRRSHPGLVVIRQEHLGPALARNRGAAAATGAILAFLDDDAEAPAGWLTAIDETFEDHPDVQGVGSQSLAAFHAGALDKRRYWKNPNAETPMPLAFEPQKWLSTHNLAVRRGAFDAVNGFLPENVCQDEDLDFLYRLLQKGFILLRTRKAVVRHHSRETFSAILGQQFHFGRTDVHIFRRFFPRQLVVDFQIGRFLRLPDFFCVQNFPFNCCLRIDFFKVFLVTLALAVWFAWLPLLYLALLWLGMWVQVKDPFFSLILLRTSLVRDAAYLAGHVRGSWEAGAVYF